MMNLWMYFKRRSLALAGVVLLSACAVPNGSNLQPDVSTLPQVLATMGRPAMVWKNPDGSEQLAFPRGPAGTQTFMAYMAPDGKMQRIEGVLNNAQFDQIDAGMSKEDVLRRLGPSNASRTATYKWSNTLAWTWLYCAYGDFQEYFNVLFDQTTGLVRSKSKSPVLLGRFVVAPTCFQY